MNVCCSRCTRRISSEHINVSKDTAYCHICGNLSFLSVLLKDASKNQFDLTQRVSGIKTTHTANSWSIDASHRSIAALILVPFTFVWAGGALTGIYGTQIVDGKFNLILSLFGLPFLVVSMIFISMTLMSLFGKTSISCENGQARLFIGIGSIGWSRRFDWRTIDRVIENTSTRNDYLSLEGSQRINFGWGLSAERSYYMFNFLISKLKQS